MQKSNGVSIAIFSEQKPGIARAFFEQLQRIIEDRPRFLVSISTQKPKALESKILFGVKREIKQARLEYPVPFPQHIPNS